MMAGPEGKSRSFAWLNVTQFFGALNDNVFQMLVILFLFYFFKADDAKQAEILFVGMVVFVVPFLLFSHAAGVLADRFSKRSIIVGAKVLELGVMLAGACAVVLEVPGANVVLYGLLFLMCTQSAIFGPSKYGVIPELVEPDQLSRANSFLVGLTYLAIILGTFLPAFILDHSTFGLLATTCVVIAVLGLLASLQIEKTAAVGNRRPFTPLFFIDIFKTFIRIRKDKPLFMAVAASAYFLALGGFIKSNLILYGQQDLGLTDVQSGYYFPIAALGIGLGALLAGRVSGRHIEFGLVPIGAIGLTLCCCLYAMIPQKALTGAALVTFFVGMSSGVFIVPLNSFVQHRSPRGQLGEILASQNFLSFLGVAVGAAILWLLTSVLRVGASMSFVAAGVLTAILAVAAIYVLPDFLIRFVVVIVARCLYRIRAGGLEHIPLTGPALLVSNHVTWVDSLLIGATQQRRIRFIMDRQIYDALWIKPLFSLMGVIPISAKDPPRKVVESLREARAALADGSLVCIFAEGGLTRNGNMRAFRPGLEKILQGTDHPIIPVYIGGAWGSVFSYYYGRLLSRLPKAFPYDVSVVFGEPLPAGSTTGDVRRAVAELSGRAFDLRKSSSRVLPRAFVKTARRSWLRQAVGDTTGKRLSFGKLLVGSVALSEKIDEMAGDSEKIGVLLPSSVGAVLVNTAVTLRGRVPVNLNFTASPGALVSAVEQCGIRTVISSRAFLEKMSQLTPPEGTVCLEDIAPTIGKGAKILALLKASFLPAGMFLTFRKPEPDDVATVIFSSGSTGEPKGVMLSHHNILSNIEGFSCVFRFEKSDRVCGILPFFHSFGFAVTLWAPLVVGFSAMYHPNPVDGAKIAEIVREERLTALLATPTFLLAYIRRAKKEDFQTLRAVVTGAEKLKKKVADAFEKRFGLRPLEGYGTTELSPVASLNLPDVEIDGALHVGTKEGSIGHPIPGVAMKIVDPDTGELLPDGEEGVLLVKGPNVMLGYLNKPDKTADVLRDGWYSTGDVARMDEDGFAFITDRLSRYSKIGGEMVPHLAIEEKFLQALDTIEQVVAVTSAPDEKKGEQLVVVHTKAAGDADKLSAIMKDSDLPNLWKPRKDNYVEIDEMPTLGSGKLDLKHLKVIARDFVEQRQGMAQKAVNKLREAL